MKNTLIVTLTLAMTALVATTASAAVKTIEVTAEVADTGQEESTRRAAKREARRLAVEQGAGTLVSSNTLVRDFEVVRDEITTSAKGFITDEKWGKLTRSGGTAKIKLTAKVRADKAQGAICNVIKAEFDPKIALLFVEKTGAPNTDWKVERGLFETEMISKLIENCFTIVEPGVKVTEVSRNGDIPQEIINKVVANTDAQYILIGASRILEQDKGKSVFENTAMQSYSMDLNLKLFNIDTKTYEAVATSKTVSFGLNPSTALRVKNKSGQRNGDYLISETLGTLFGKIAERWSSDLVNSSRVELHVKNVKNYSSVQKFKRALAKTYPEGKVTSKGSFRNKKAVFYVNVDGGAESLAEKLEKGVGSQSVEVLEVVKGRVVLTLN